MPAAATAKKMTVFLLNFLISKICKRRLFSEIYSKLDVSLISILSYITSWSVSLHFTTVCCKRNWYKLLFLHQTLESDIWSSWHNLLVGSPIPSLVWVLAGLFSATEGLQVSNRFVSLVSFLDGLGLSLQVVSKK